MKKCQKFKWVTQENPSRYTTEVLFQASALLHDTELKNASVQLIYIPLNFCSQRDDATYHFILMHER